MERRFTIEDTLSNKLSLFHLLLLMASLPFDLFYSHLILISLIIHTILQFKKVQRSLFSKETALLCSVFLVTVYSTIYTANRAAAYQEWGRQIPILLFPLVFCVLKLDLNRYRMYLLIGFALACTATVIFLFLYAVYTLGYYGMPFDMLFSGAFTNHNFSAPIAIHATFLSMQVGLSLIILLSAFIFESDRFFKLLLLLGVLILCAGLVQLSSKSVCGCVLVMVNLGLPIFLRHRIPVRKYVLTSLTVTLLIAGLIFGTGRSGMLRERFAAQLQNDLSESPAREFGDSRLSRWKLALALVSEAPITGHGAGTEIQLLGDSFFEHQLYRSFLSRLNAHNQYLSFLIKSGLAGLLVYFITLFFGFWRAVSKADHLFFAFVLLIAFVSCSENLLDVNKGIIFYAFFFSFFLFSAGRWQPFE